MSTTLQFRNVDASPQDPVRSWPIEALQTALAQGGLSQWRRIVAVINDDPWGPVARDVEYVLSYDHPYGVAELMQRAIANARTQMDSVDKAEVARRIRAALLTSGASQQQFAERTGTSQSRLSTYLSGKVTPSAAFLLRAERIAHRWS